MSEFLAGEDIRQVYFDNRDIEQTQCVVHGNRCVGIGASVDGQSGSNRSCLLDPGHEFTLMIRLAKLQVELRFGCGVPAALFDIRKRFAAIDTGFPFTEQVQVGAIENPYGFLRCHVIRPEVMSVFPLPCSRDSGQSVGRRPAFMRLGQTCQKNSFTMLRIRL